MTSSTPFRTTLLLATALASGLLGPGCAEAAPDADAGPEIADAAGLTILDPQDPDRPYFFALGTIPYGTIRDFEIRLRNDEARPIGLKDVLTGCGCTVPTVRTRAPDGSIVERRPRAGRDPVELAPGAVATIAVRIDSTQVKVTGKPKLVNVRVRSDATANPFLTIELSFTIDKPFTVNPPALRFAGVPKGGLGSAEVQIFCHGPDGNEITQVLSAPAFIDTELELRTEVLPPIWVLKARLQPRSRVGSFQDEIVLGSTGPHGEGTGRPFAVPVHVEVVEDVAVSPTRLQLPRVVPGSDVAARADVRMLLAGHRLAVQDWRVVGSGSKHLRVDVQPIAPVDDRGRSPHWRVELTTAAGLAEPEFSGDVVLATDDPAWSEIRIPYAGTLAD